ncbi:MAG: DUF4031 domain-containing protein [bacterium]|nr:DUF4031 domain-containing protein [bacterium]
MIQPNPNWRWEQSCHLWGDSTEELHAFAKHIGLRLSWFQNHDRLPHYDLTPNRRVIALRAGAYERSLKEYIRELRKQTSNPG